MTVARHQARWLANTCGGSKTATIKSWD